MTGTVALALLYLLVQMQPAEAVPLPDTPDPSQPSIKVLSPLMRTYNSSKINLNLEIKKPSSWFGQLGYFPGDPTRQYYCTGRIDYVQCTLDAKVIQNFAVKDVEPFRRIEHGTYVHYEMVTYSSPLSSKLVFSTNLHVEEGKHSIEIAVFATNYYYEHPNYRTQSVNCSTEVPLFYTWYTSPKVSLISPQSNTYSDTEIPLTFEVDRPAVCVYSLDGAGNSSQLVGNTTLAGLTAGSHSLVVYATNAAANSAKTDTVLFTIAASISSPSPTQTPTPSLTPTLTFTPSQTNTSPQTSILPPLASPAETRTSQPSQAQPFLNDTAITVIVIVSVVLVAAVAAMLVLTRKSKKQ